jgi:hypothetical protein
MNARKQWSGWWCWLVLTVGVAAFVAGCASDSSSRRNDSGSGGCSSCGK